MARRNSKPATTTAAAPQRVDVLVIGAGFSGIGAAIRMLENGITDFLVLEKADGPGGTWRDNTYPGCACDVPSALYSYSFAQKPDWSRVFAAQPEILDYVHDTVERFGVNDYIRYGEPAEDSAWDETLCRWVVRTPRQKLIRDMAEDGATRMAAYAFTPAQLDAYGAKELHVLETLLRQGDRKTFRDVADRIAKKIGWTRGPYDTDRDFLSAYYAALRGRLEQKLLMGVRRRDKHDV